jgi:polar amino acid transport system substrate-binding protein
MRFVRAVALALLASPAAGADLDAVKQRGTLRVLFVPSQGISQFFHHDSARPGLDREILEGFAHLQRLQLEAVPIAGWDELSGALVAGRGDVVAGSYTVTESRLRTIAFTSEVFPTRAVVVTRKPTRVIRTHDELLRERIGTVRGTSMAEALAQAGVPAAKIDDTLPPGGQVAALVSGKVTLVVLGLENAIAEQRADPQLQLGMFLGPEGSLAFGVRKADVELRRALDDYITSLRKSGGWSRLVVKYFGERALDALKGARAE